MKSVVDSPPLQIGEMPPQNGGRHQKYWGYSKYGVSEVEFLLQETRL